MIVQLVPRIYYYSASSSEDEFDKYPSCYQQEPISLTLAVILGLGVAADVGTSTGCSGTDFKELRTAMDEDLRALEQSISKLVESMTLLSEVVLLNRHGLNLLFLKEGGLCAALKNNAVFT